MNPDIKELRVLSTRSKHRCYCIPSTYIVHIRRAWSHHLRLQVLHTSDWVVPSETGSIRHLKSCRSWKWAQNLTGSLVTKRIQFCPSYSYHMISHFFDLWSCSVYGFCRSNHTPFLVSTSPFKNHGDCSCHSHFDRNVKWSTLLPVSVCLKYRLVYLWTEMATIFSAEVHTLIQLYRALVGKS